MSDLNKPEPPPIVMAGKPATWDLVVDDMRERDRQGRAKYGTPLQPHNGRNNLVDAYQEVLDLAVYLRNEIEEKRKEYQMRERLRVLAEMVLCLRKHWGYVNVPHTMSSQAGKDWQALQLLIETAEFALREMDA